MVSTAEFQQKSGADVLLRRGTKAGLCLGLSGDSLGEQKTMQFKRHFRRALPCFNTSRWWDKSRNGDWVVKCCDSTTLWLFDRHSIGSKMRLNDEVLGSIGAHSCHGVLFTILAAIVLITYSSFWRISTMFASENRIFLLASPNPFLLKLLSCFVRSVAISSSSFWQCALTNGQASCRFLLFETTRFGGYHAIFVHTKVAWLIMYNPHNGVPFLVELYHVISYYSIIYI